MIIYKLTSPSGWVYVGQTSNFKRRMQGHKDDAANHRDSCVLLCRAIRKYGWENFTKEILACDIPGNLVDEIEVSLISKYKILGASYNIESGGNKNKKHSDTTRKKMSDFRKGYVGWNHSDSAKIKMSENNGKYWLGRFGKDNKKSKPVVQYDLNNNIVKEWDSAMDASRALGISNTAISNLCTGVRCNSHGKKSHVRKTVGGFIWKHKTNVVNPINVT